jgi:hypothetical protein
MSGFVNEPGCATEPVRCRKFGLFDAMILIAGTALCLAAGAPLFGLLADAAGHLWASAVVYRGVVLANPMAFWRGTHDHLRNSLWYGFQVTETFLVGLWPTFFVLRLRRPRPPLRALLRQPGTVAGLAMAFGLFWGTGCLLLLFPDKVDSMTAAAIAVGGTVAVSWVILALSREWQSGPGWVDRLGQLLGCAAIGTALLGLIVFRI